MGGWKRTRPTVYFVAWPGGIFKVGYSERQRWRRFVLRGARVIRLVEFDSFAAAFALEAECHAVLNEVATPAWQHPAGATPYLGDSGGYRECYRIPPEQCERMYARIATASCDGIANALRPGYARTDVRTDGLTDAYSPTSETSSNATPAGGHTGFADSRSKPPAPRLAITPLSEAAS